MPHTNCFQNLFFKIMGWCIWNTITNTPLCCLREAVWQKHSVRLTSGRMEVEDPFNISDVDLTTGSNGLCAWTVYFIPFAYFVLLWSRHILYGSVAGCAGNICVNFSLTSEFEFIQKLSWWRVVWNDLLRRICWRRLVYLQIWPRTTKCTSGTPL